MRNPRVLDSPLDSRTCFVAFVTFVVDFPSESRTSRLHANAGIASRLTIERHWPGVGEPGRWA